MVTKLPLNDSPEKYCDFHPSQKNFTEKSGGKVLLTSIKQMKLPDAIKWRAHNLYIACDTELFDKRIKPWEL